MANMHLKLHESGFAAIIYRHVLDDKTLKLDQRRSAQLKLDEANEMNEKFQDTLQKLRVEYEECVASEKARQDAAAREALRSKLEVAATAGSLQAMDELKRDHLIEMARASAASLWAKRFSQVTTAGDVSESKSVAALKPSTLATLVSLLVHDARDDSAIFIPALASQDEVASTAALGEWADRLRKVVGFDRLLAETMSGAEKIDALASWSILWPPLNEFDHILQHHGIPPIADAASLIAPLITEYIANLTTRFDSELEAAWRRETWLPITEPSTGSTYAVVVWDLFKLFMSSFEVFLQPLKEGGPMRAEWVEMLAERCFFILNKFLNRMRQSLGSESSLMKPKPQYSDLYDLRDRATSISRQIKSALAPSQRPNSTREEFITNALQTMDSMCVRIESLLYCHAQLANLANFIDSRWKEFSDHTFEQVAPEAPMTVLHAGAPEAVTATIVELCWFAGAKVMYQDMSVPLLEELYCRESRADAELRPTLSSGEPQLLVQLLDGLLLKVNDKFQTDSNIIARTVGLRDRLVRSVMVACVQVLERILLDGGSRRIFTPLDGPTLLVDIQLVRDFFIAKDEHGKELGLASQEVMEITARLEGIVALMHRPSEELVEEFTRSDSVPDWHDVQPLTKCNIARVLLHRLPFCSVTRAWVASHRDRIRKLLLENQAKSESVRDRFRA